MGSSLKRARGVHGVGCSLKWAWHVHMGLNAHSYWARDVHGVGCSLKRARDVHMGFHYALCSGIVTSLHDTHDSARENVLLLDIHGPARSFHKSA